jgi:hypothetical protein
MNADRWEGLLTRYEETGTADALMVAGLPIEPPAGADSATLRRLALLRWYRYRRLPGVDGILERWALLAVL